MVKTIETIESVPEIGYLIVELRVNALQSIDPENTRFRNYRKLVIEGMLPDEVLSKAYTEMMSLLPIVGSLVYSFDNNGVQTTPLKIELLNCRSATGYMRPEDLTGKFVPTGIYMRQRLISDAGRVLNCQNTLQAFGEGNVKIPVG